MIQVGTPVWREIRSVPNLISLSRLVFLPVLVALIVSEKWIWGGLLALFLGLTDFADGYVARRFNLVTRLGALLDPLIDRIIIVVVLLALVLANAVPIWVFWAIVTRDSLVLLVRYLKSQKIGVEVVYLGKMGTWFLYVCFVLIFITEISNVRWISDFTLAGFIWGTMLYWLAGFRYLRE